MEKVKVGYWVLYLVTCFLIYFNGSFVNASFDITLWPRISREQYGFAFLIASIVALGIAILIRMVDIHDTADKIAKEKLEEERRKIKVN